MRIAVVGVGDQGARLAARLITSGEDVILIARGKTLQRLKTEGLNATQGSTVSGMHVDDINATDDCSSIGPVDVILMCVKLYQLADAMETASHLVGSDTTVLGFQNGVFGEDRLIERFSSNRVVGVATSVASVPLSIGELPRGRSDRTSAIVKIFRKAGVNVIEHDNVMEAIWRKFIMVSGAAITALSRVPIGEMAKVPELRQSGTMAVKETVELANVKGFPFGQEIINQFESILDEMATSNPAWRPSLLQDLEAGRPLELDAWSGGAVNIGQELGIATPVNFSIYAALKPYENGSVVIY